MEENVSNGRHHQNFESVVRRHLATDVRSNERFEEELDDDADEEMVGVTDGQAEMNRHNTVVTEAAPAEPENVEAKFIKVAAALVVGAVIVGVATGSIGWLTAISALFACLVAIEEHFSPS
ncbi:hypothetical protein AAVH_13113 [Aphelenchoides avenae]|nr:hypothetical protein AAVH_13113 [Aphelenchus avenae]